MAGITLSAAAVAEGAMPRPVPSASRSRATEILRPVAPARRWRSGGRRMQPCRASGGEGRQVRGSTLTNRQSIEKTLREAGLSIGFGNGEEPSPSLAAPSPSSLSWAEWQDLFMDLHEGQSRTMELQEAMHAAVAEERYAEASQLKALLTEAQASDTVQQAEQELQAAVAAEDYGQAAAVRDSTGLGLLGWWAGQGEDDPCGHLLHVTRSFGRLAARVYTPSQLAEMKGWTAANPLRQNVKLSKRAPQNLGQLALEMFLQKNASGAWEQQPVVLQHSRAVPHSVELGSHQLDVADPARDAVDLDDAEEGAERGAASPSAIGSLRRAPAALMTVSRDQFVVVPSQEAPPSGSECGATIRLEAVNANEQPVALDLPLTESMDEAAQTGTWGKVAEAIAEMQERMAPAPSGEAAKAQLADNIRAAIEQLAEDGAVAGGVTVDLAKQNVRGAKTVNDGFISDTTTYKRLAVPTRSCDPLDGIYLGAFGAHGPEVLSVRRGRDEDGSECVMGVKATGDVNVPAGQVSFRVKTGPGDKLANNNMYPRELGVVARYKGQGCVAQPGFTNPKWVDGELLVFGPQASLNAKASVTGGAELGFVWTLPAPAVSTRVSKSSGKEGEEGKEAKRKEPSKGKKFLILMNRVELDDMVMSNSLL